MVAFFFRPQFPNTTSHWDPDESKEVCGNTAATGCLYNVDADPGEHDNLAATKASQSHIYHRSPFSKWRRTS